MLETDLGFLLGGTGYNTDSITPEILRKLYEIEHIDLTSPDARPGYDKGIDLPGSSGRMLFSPYSKVDGDAHILIINPTRKEKTPEEVHDRTESFFQRRIMMPLEMRVDTTEQGLHLVDIKIAEFYTGPIDSNDEQAIKVMEYFRGKMGTTASYREFQLRAHMLGIERELAEPAFYQMIEDVIEATAKIDVIERLFRPAPESDRPESGKARKRHLRLVEN